MIFVTIDNHFSGYAWDDLLFLGSELNKMKTKFKGFREKNPVVKNEVQKKKASKVMARNIPKTSDDTKEKVGAEEISKESEEEITEKAVKELSKDGEKELIPEEKDAELDEKTDVKELVKKVDMEPITEKIDVKDSGK